MQQKNEESASKTKLLVGLIILICAVVLAVHWTSLSAKTLSIDDDQYFTENLLVQNPSWKSAWRFLSEVLEPSTVGGYYQPLTMISLMVDYALGGRVDNLMPFHRTSLALHIANTALIIVLLYLLFGNVWAAAGLGLLFGIHPMTVEPITWVSDRKTLLAAFFAFWSLILYVGFARKKNRGLFFGCLITYILALMSKPTSTPLPLMMLLMDYWPLKRLNWQAVLEKIPLLVVGVVSAVITYISQSRTATVVLPIECGPQHIPLVICHNIVFYLYKIFWLVKLPFYYPFPLRLTLTNPMIAAGVIGTCILIPLLIISLRWTRAVLTGWLIFFVAMLPTMQIIGFSGVIAADKFAYLPSVGLLMILASFAAQFCNANKNRLWHIAIAFVLLISAGTEAVCTRKYLVHWRNMISLSKYFLSQTPDAAQINLMMGYALQREGKLVEAEYYCRRSIQLAPRYTDAINNLALVLRLQGKPDEAVELYRQASKGTPKDANIFYNLGNALLSLGKFNEAVSQYYEALKINPEHAYAHNNLANALLEQGKHNEAIDHYRQALKLKPSYADAYNNLGTILEAQDKLDEAVDCYSRALDIKPDFPEANQNLIYALALQNKLDGAIKYYRQVLHINIEQADAYNAFGMGLLSRGKTNEAIIQFQHALQAKPDFVNAYLNLASLFESQGKLDEAVVNYRKALQFQPDDINLHLTVGNLLASQNKFDEAISHFNQSLRLAPNNADTHYNLGMALMTIGRPSEAIEHLNKAIQLNPFWYEPALWIARILATYPDSEARDPNKAVIIATHAAELTKYKDPEVLETLATSYAAAGQLDLAVKTAQEALVLAGTARNNELAGRLHNAIEQYKQGLTNTKPEINTKTNGP